MGASNECEHGQLARSCELCEKDAEIAELKAWIDDLQSGMYINCVYCGHRYGPRESTPMSMADVLKEHVEQCPKHPMSELKAEVGRLKNPHGAVDGWVRKVKGKPLRFESIYTISRVPNDLKEELVHGEEVIPVLIVPREDRP